MPAPSTGDTNAPLLATTWCFSVSLLTHVIKSPALIVTLVGENAVRVIFTVFVAVPCGDAGAAPASASRHVNGSRSFFIS